MRGCMVAWEWRLLIFLSGVLALGSTSFGQTFSVASTSIRPFVIAFTPVIGRNGAVGGILVNSAGVIRRAAPGDDASLRRLWRESRGPLSDELARHSSRRMISLNRLARLLAKHVATREPLPEEVLFLGGLQRVDYVMAYPAEKDILLVGSAGGWSLGEGTMVHRDRPVLRLDDLIVAMRTMVSAEEAPTISCSIDPTDAGLLQLKSLLERRDVVFNESLVQAMEQALGEQQIRLEAIPENSHFARVLVGADFQMKRLAMGIESSELGMLSYMDRLHSAAPRSKHVSAPRWWLALDEHPVTKSTDGLVWNLSDLRVRVMTEDGYLNAAGRLVDLSRENPQARRWAAEMTGNYERLSREFPVFGQLRGCIDLAVAASIISHEGLAERTGCDLTVFTDPRYMQCPAFNTPRTIDSQASLLRTRRGWIVGISGGVEIDPRQVIQSMPLEKSLSLLRWEATPPKESDRWWWD